MKSIRIATPIVALVIAVAAPAQALASGPGSSQITPTAPSRLTTTTTTPTSTTAGSLPDTGLNLMPETVAGLALLGVGVGLRTRRFRA